MFLKSRYARVRQRDFTHHAYIKNRNSHIFIQFCPGIKRGKGSDLLKVWQAGIGEDYAVQHGVSEVSVLIIPTMYKCYYVIK